MHRLHTISACFQLRYGHGISWPWMMGIHTTAMQGLYHAKLCCGMSDRDSCVCRQHQSPVHILFTGHRVLLILLTNMQSALRYSYITAKYCMFQRNTCWSISLTCLIARVAFSVVFAPGNSLIANLFVGLALKRSFAQGVWRFLPIPPLVACLPLAAVITAIWSPKWRLMAGTFARALAETDLKMPKHRRLVFNQHNEHWVAFWTTPPDSSLDYTAGMKPCWGSRPYSADRHQPPNHPKNAERENTPSKYSGINLLASMNQSTSTNMHKYSLIPIKIHRITHGVTLLALHCITLLCIVLHYIHRFITLRHVTLRYITWQYLY